MAKAIVPSLMPAEISGDRSKVAKKTLPFSPILSTALRVGCAELGPRVRMAWVFGLLRKYALTLLSTVVGSSPVSMVEARKSAPTASAKPLQRSNEAGVVAEGFPQREDFTPPPLARPPPPLPAADPRLPPGLIPPPP